MKRKMQIVLGLVLALRMGCGPAWAQELYGPAQTGEAELFFAEEENAFSEEEEEVLSEEEKSLPQEAETETYGGWVIHRSEPEELFTDGDSEDMEILLPHGMILMYGDSEDGGFHLYEDGYLWMYFGKNLTPEKTSIFREGELCEYPITAVTLEGTLEEIEDEAFRGFDELREVEISDHVTRIGKMAFRDCGSLETVKLPKNLTQLDYRAFSECTSLRQMEIPDSAADLGPRVFSDCSNLTEVHLPSSLTEIPYGLFEYCGALEQIEIPGGVMKVGYEAFMGCSKLREVITENGFSEMEFSAFANCTSLESVRLAKGIEWIDREAFLNCESLEEVVLPDTVKRIYERAFCGCRSLKEVELPKRLKRVGDRAFYNCSGLTEIRSLAGNIQVVGELAFGYEAVKKRSKKVEGVKIRGYGSDALEMYALVHELDFEALVPMELDTPVIREAANQAKGIRITWEPVKGAEGYRVFRKSGSQGWKPVFDLTGTEYVDTAVTNGVSYSYMVRCTSQDGKKYSSGYDPVGKEIFCLERPVLTKYKNRSQKEAAVWWTGNPQADGYRVRCGVNGVKKLHLVARNDKTFYAFKNLPEGASCRLAVQSYKDTLQGRIFSGWSVAASVVIE